METTPPDKEGRSGLPSELGFAIVPRKTDPAPVVTRSSEEICAEPILPWSLGHAHGKAEELA